MDATLEFFIRLATFSELEALRDLIELSVRVLQKDDYSAAQIEGALHFTLGVDTRLIEDQTYFVAEPIGHPGIIVACGGWSNRKTLFGSDGGPNREDALLNPANDAAKIRAIFVHPEWARRGLGTLILTHCEEAAYQAGFRSLEMGSTVTGERLYRFRGYVAYANEVVPLPNGEKLSVILMAKTL